MGTRMRPRLNQRIQFSLAYVLVAAMVLLLLQSWLQAPRTVEIPMSKFLDLVRADKIEKVALTEKEIRGIAKPDALPTPPSGPGDRLRQWLGSDAEVRVFTVTRIPGVEEAPLIAELEKHKVEFTGRIESTFVRDLFFGWIIPLGVMVGIWMFLMRRVGGGPTQALSFGRSKHKIFDRKELKTTFVDVAAVDEAKAELVEIVDFLKNPKKYQRLGGRIPKGVLLVGPPGTGKTLLARAVAGEAGVPFFSISGSDYVEMFVGVGASRVRDLFMPGKKHAPCIIFIDEIDAVGRHRGAGLGGGHDEREQTLNQLLVEMDGFESNEGVIMIAATNRPDVLDPALLRPGRFDRRVVVPRPDLRGRLAILQVHTKRVNLASDVDLEVIARGTPGFVGADLQNLVNEAALLAARRDANQVHRVDFEAAKDKVVLGTERKSLIMSDEDKRSTAYHEAGHALVALLSPHADPVHKVTIIPRGMALGVTWTMPLEDQYSLNRDQILARIRHAMGGRAAEELVFGQFTTGASNDLKQATELARRMVCSYGMSEKVGPGSFADDDHDVFLGRDFVARKDYSESKAREIEEEITRILHSLYGEAKQMLLDHRATL